jgi:hypothetical protein
VKATRGSALSSRPPRSGCRSCMTLRLWYAQQAETAVLLPNVPHHTLTRSKSIHMRSTLAVLLHRGVLSAYRTSPSNHRSSMLPSPRQGQIHCTLVYMYLTTVLWMTMTGGRALLAQWLPSCRIGVFLCHRPSLVGHWPGVSEAVTICSQPGWGGGLPSSS